VRDEPVRPPRQLPAAVPGFTGREAVLAGLTAALETNGVGVAVCGMGGVGKTALVVRWAHRAAERFPDGQLYVNLRGFDPSADPLDPSAALGIVLEGLGVAAGRIPRNLDARSALYRSLLADKRVLVVLDNARDEQQVRPLLPGGGGRVLITSRRELVGLAAVEGVALINLDVLSGPEARRLLAARLAEPAGSAALHRVAERCGGLPLALSIVAARVASRPVPSLATVAEELRAGGQILDLLATSDITGDVAAVFSWSYRTLSGPAARLFRLLALHPGPDFAPAAAASLAGLPAAATRRLLDELLDAHLLEGKAPDRFTFHDLVRSYARGLAAQDPEAEPARRRLLDHYLGSSEHARTLLYRYSDEPAVIPDRDGVTPETFGHPDAALAWLEAERQCLADLTCYAAEHRIDRYAIELPASTYRYLHGQGRFQEAAVAQRIAVAAAREKDEPAREALALRRLGRSLTGPENRGEAWAALLRALDLTERIGDAVGQARTHSGLGHLAYQDGHHPEALHHHERALDLFRRAGNRGGVALSMNNAAFSRMVLGDAKGAIPLCEEAIAIFAEDDSHTTEPCAWDTLGLAHQRLGDHAEAIRCLRRALELCEETGERWGRAEVLDHLGDAHLAAGDRAAAAAAWRGAIDIIAELDASKAERARAKLAELAAG
jgi:tetratricopeptide (TPR) repeat protein